MKQHLTIQQFDTEITRRSDLTFPIQIYPDLQHKEPDLLVHMVNEMWTRQIAAAA